MHRRSMTILALALAARTAHAQPSDAAAAEAALAEGRRLDDLQEWDAAIDRFKESYRLRADAPALFNIAQAYRLKGDCAQAASSTRRSSATSPSSATSTPSSPRWRRARSSSPPGR